MTKSLYVGNLPWSATEEEVRSLFANHGNVSSVKLVSDRETGRARGFGFVEMATEEEAQKAIDMFNGQEIAGRRVTVNEARPLTERPERTNNWDNRSTRSF